MDEHDSAMEVNKRPRLTLYGEINEQELFQAETKKEEEKLVLNEQERVQMEQAETNVREEKAHIESYNRFKDLQAQYSKAFSYPSQTVDVFIKCRSCYLPLEARMDRDSFEQLLVKTQPKNLVLIHGKDVTFHEISRFCASNRLDVKVKRADQFRGSLKFATNAGVKQVFIENQLLKSLALQKVAHKRFEVARIVGEIRPQVDKQLIFDELEMPRDIKAINEKAAAGDGQGTEKAEGLTEQQIRAKQRFERKSLFLMSKEYRLAELHTFLT